MTDNTENIDLSEMSKLFEEEIEQEDKVKKKLISFGIKLGLFIGILFILFGVIFNVQIVKGNYMYPSLKDGDLVISLKIGNYYNNDDVVYYQTEDGVQYGRIEAQEGDSVTIEDGTIKVNGLLPSSTIFYDTVSDDNIEVTVDNNSYYILNDMRTDTTDSRTYGSIDKSAIKGKVIFIIRRRGF